jgi:O-methyltransferase
VNLLLKLYSRILLIFQMPVLLAPYFEHETGRDYGLGFWGKLGLALRMAANTRRVTSASHLLEHLTMATSLLRMPRSVVGCVVECGSYKGGSATNMSLVCRITGRRLHVFDSFEGLPEPTEIDRSHVLVIQGETHNYVKGAWAGSLDEVRSNISRFGAIECCEFHKGYFDKTLPSFREPVVQAFVDVDLVASLEPCVRILWPLLQVGGTFYTHEAQHQEIAAFFYDTAWWHEQLGEPAPGLVGAGTGLGLLPARGSYRSDLGLVVKGVAAEALRENLQLGMQR